MVGLGRRGREAGEGQKKRKMGWEENRSREEYKILYSIIILMYVYV